MANTSRIIQFKRNTTPASNAAEAKLRMSSQSLVNGELIIGSYYDAKSHSGIADILGIKAQGNLYTVDVQTILNKLGIRGDGTEDSQAANDSIIKQIADIAGGGSATSGTIENIITGAGLNANGTYTADPSDKFLSGATSLKDADSKLSTEINAIEDFVGMGSGGGESIVGRIDALSGKAVTQVESTSSITLTKESASDGTQKIKADIKASAVEGNIIQIKSDGIYSYVDYNAVTNSIIINGESKQLNAGSIIDSIAYNSATEELVITYHSSSSSEPIEVKVSLADLIEEYAFDTTGSDPDYNVKFTVDRSVSGATSVKADVLNFDCGEY